MMDYESFKKTVLENSFAEEHTEKELKESYARYVRREKKTLKLTEEELDK